jgi:hypothetical protein
LWSGGLSFSSRGHDDAALGVVLQVTRGPEMKRARTDLETFHADLKSVKERLLALETKRRKRRGLVFVTAVVLVSATAFAQLLPFNGGSPALARDLNTNFNQLKTWLELKVGPVGQGVTLALPLATPLPGSELADGTVTISKLELNARTALTCPAANGTTIVFSDADRSASGMCIFFKQAPPPNSVQYSLNYNQAAAACKADGARLCTVGEMSAAQAAGLNWCAYGWLADRTTDATAYSGYPNQTASVSCGAAGMRFLAEAMTTLRGAWCCK